MKLSLVILSSWLLASPVLAQKSQSPSPPVISDFSHVMALDAGEQAPGYDLQLPRQVYPYSRAALLRDLRVFNGNNELLPTRIADPGDHTNTNQSIVDMPVFQLSQGRWVRHRETLTTTTTEQVGSASIYSKRKLLMSYRSRQNALSNDEYILDAAAAGSAWISTLILDYEHPLPGNYVFSVAVDGTRDFNRWYTLAKNVRLIDFNAGNLKILKKRIKLSAQGYPFYRIRFASHAITPELLAVQAETQQSETIVSTIYEMAPVSSSGEGMASYLFENPDGLHIERLEIRAPADNTVVRFSLFSKPDADADWYRRGAGLLYRMRVAGERFDNDPFSVSPNSDRYWYLSVDGSSGGLGGGLPSVSLGWVPHRLQFLARGKPPFVLAMGNPRQRRAAPTQWYEDMRATGLVDAFKTLSTNTAVVPNPLYTPNSAPHASTLLRFLLWALLLAVVGTMIYFSLKLIRSND